MPVRCILVITRRCSGHTDIGPGNFHPVQVGNETRIVLHAQLHIHHVGRVTEEEKVAALGQCRLLVMPSPYESLSIITLEAWKLGTPVLANGRCRVLMGQCLRSNGGLFYHGYAEFAEGLRLLLEKPQLAASLGRQGRDWVDTECAWETVEGRVEELLERTG